MAGMLAAAVVSASAVQVHAMRPWHSTKATCQADGYVWDDVKGCADEYCNDGLMGYGDPGETQVWQNHIYMCDGFSGQWTQVRLVHVPTGLPVVTTVGNVEVVQPTPTNPLAHPLGGVLAR